MTRGVRLTLEGVRERLADRGIKLISDVYINNRTELRVEGPCGHQWDAIFTNLVHKNQNKQSRGCPTCTGRRHTVEEAQALARSRGGTCNSKEWVSSGALMQWTCSEGHSWAATWNAIYSGKHWCKYCADNSPVTLQDAQKLAESRGGKCLSKVYINAHDLLQWVCSEGHTWSASWCGVFSGKSWCRICSEGILYGERACRIALECFLGVSFNKTRALDFLRNKNNRNMEIDCYSPDLRLGCEFDGAQHQKTIQYFGMTSEKLVQRQAADRLKDKLCVENGVTLMRVSSSEAPLQRIPHVVYKKLVDLGYQPLISAEGVDLSPLYRLNKFSDADLCTAFCECANIYGRTPSRTEWGSFAREFGYPSRSAVEKRYGTFSAFVILAGQTPNPAHGLPKYTDSEILNQLCKVACIHGFFPRSQWWKAYANKNDGVSSLTAIVKRFGSWGVAKQKAYTLLRRCKGMVPVDPCDRGTKLKMLEQMCAYIQGFGGLPTRHAWAGYAQEHNAMSASSYRSSHYFGSWSAAKQAAIDYMPTYLETLEAPSDDLPTHYPPTNLPTNPHTKVN